MAESKMKTEEPQVVAEPISEAKSEQPKAEELGGEPGSDVKPEQPGAEAIGGAPRSELKPEQPRAGAVAGEEFILEEEKSWVMGDKERARTLLVAVDESENSSYLLKFVMRTIAQKEDTIILLNAYTDVQMSLYGEPSPWMSQIEATYKSHSEKLLRKLSATTEKLKVKSKLLSVKGDARDVLQDAAKTLKPDMLIIGSRGLGMIKRAFLGSVSDYAARHVECPVLIVKQPPSAAHTDSTGIEKLGNLTAQAA